MTIALFYRDVRHTKLGIVKRVSHARYGWASERNDNCEDMAKPPASPKNADVTKPRNRFNVRFWHKADIPLCIEYAVSSPEPVSST
jgi:hypothetical protein